MRSHVLFSTLLCAGSAACGSSTSAQPDAASAPTPDAQVAIDAAPTTPDAPASPDAPPAPVATTVQVLVREVPLLIAFRDGADAPWQPATMTTPGTFEITVHGPYVVTVVRDLGSSTRHAFVTEQVARTPDDDHRIVISALPDQSGSVVTGHMVQAGSVALGAAQALSFNPEWSVRLRVDPGVHDLIATTEDAILIKHALTVAGDLTLSTIDTATDGTALVSVALTASNVAADAKLSAGAAVATPSTSRIDLMRSGPASATKVAPDSVLAARDVQTVLVQATEGTRIRALRRPFRVGGDTSFAMPTLIVNPAFTAASDLALSWTSLSDATSLRVSANNDSFVQSISLDVTPRFLAATARTQLVVDTQIPGFEPTWRVNYAAPYSRSWALKHTAEPVVETDQLGELVD